MRGRKKLDQENRKRIMRGNRRNALVDTLEGDKERERGREEEEK